MNFTTAPDLRNLTDDQLADMFAGASEAEAAAILAECKRRDKCQRERDRRAAIRAEWMLVQHAQYLAADAECRGNLLSKAGKKAGVSEFSLWTGREDVARKYASEELNDYWNLHGRLTVTEYASQRAEAGRIAREEAREIREHAKYVRSIERAARKVTRKAERRARLTVINGGAEVTTVRHAVAA